MDTEFSLAGIGQTAGQLAKLVADYKVVAVHGEMGAGKTTLISALCRSLGSHDVIGSPTFSIINQYLAEN